jgi:uncharacterized glyoxalase superfamily protein PhnB
MRSKSDPSKSGFVATLRYRDVVGATEWLCAAFGFRTQHVIRHEDGSIHYAMLAYGGDTIILFPADDLNAATQTNGPGTDCAPSLQSCYCIIDDVEAHYRNAEAQGAFIVEELGDYEFIGSGYSCRDPEGHVWNFGTRDPRQLRVEDAGRSSRTTSANRSARLIVAVFVVVGIALATVWWMFGANERSSLSARVDEHPIHEVPRTGDRASGAGPSTNP